MLFDGLSLGEETIVKRGFVADLSMIGADVEKLAFRSKGVTSVLREKSHKIFSAWKIKKRTCQCTKYTKQKKERKGTRALYSYFIKYKYMFPYTKRSMACHCWADLTLATWSSSSRGLEKHLVNYFRKSSLSEYLRFCFCGHHL